VEDPVIRLLIAVASGLGCYFAATAGVGQLAIALGILAVVLVAHVVLTDHELVLHIVKIALSAGAAFTGIALVISIQRDHVSGAALYGLLLLMCVVGLLIKPADKRPTA
jgi:ABC-type multidrug transport system permease subunit